MSSRAAWTLRLTTPESARSGARIRFSLTLTNNAAERIDFYLRGREIAFDIVVVAADETIVWRRLQGEIIPAIVQIRALAPRETLDLMAHWDQRSNGGTRVAPGDYTVRASLLTEGDPLEAPPVRIRIESP